MSEELPDWTAMLDQMRRGLTDFASMVRVYYTGLIAEGFTPEEALTLTLAFQTQIQRDGRE